MAARFNSIPPNTKVKPKPFTFHVPEDEVQSFKVLLKHSKIGPKTFWNQQEDTNEFGVSRNWLIHAKETWLNKFDWRKHEAYINSFPNFQIPVVESPGGDGAKKEKDVNDIHFAALFSNKPDAIPLLFLHGFPAAFTEFLPVLELLAEKYTPETLPYHVIVPSLPDYGLSYSSPDAEMTVERAAGIMNQLMVNLGFGDGYVVQGGDLGSMIARIMSVEYDACKAFHLNMLVLNPDQKEPPRDILSFSELQMLERTEKWRQTGLAYALEHGTRPSTAGLAISTSPLAMLAWLGEKLLEWTDPSAGLPLDEILSTISFYWFTDTFSRSLYHATLVKMALANKPHPISMSKPLGYSHFAHDLVILPRAWAEEIYPNLMLYKSHSEGGHFASVERPREFLEDVEEFVAKVSELFGSK
ncbi:Alpha/Beta hydrolase protein [Xylariaceae sp. FL0255]|nr:Alpha/Beta hydrolase protein [Xylariaceae sp. FL0255]